MIKRISSIWVEIQSQRS